MTRLGNETTDSRRFVTCVIAFGDMMTVVESFQVEGDLPLSALLGCRVFDRVGYGWIPVVPGRPADGPDDEGYPALLATIDGVAHAFWPEASIAPGREPVLRASRVDLPSWPLPPDAGPPRGGPPGLPQVCQLAWRRPECGEWREGGILGYVPQPDGRHELQAVCLGTVEDDRVLVAVSERDGRPLLELGARWRTGRGTRRFVVPLTSRGSADRGQRVQATLRVEQMATVGDVSLHDPASWVFREVRLGAYLALEGPAPGDLLAVSKLCAFPGVPVLLDPGADVVVDAEYAGERPGGGRLCALLVVDVIDLESRRRREVVARVSEQSVGSAYE